MITKSDRGEWVIPDEDVKTLRFAMSMGCDTDLRTQVLSILPAPEEEPAPCPWCGSKAELVDSENYVSCVVATCGSGPYLSTRAEAVAAWNRVVKLLNRPSDSS